MRKRTDKEKQTLGQVEVIFRQLRMDKNNGGYMPLLDTIVYAYAFPYEELTKIINDLSTENYYLGIRVGNTSITQKEMLYQEMVHTIKSAIDCPDKRYLKALELDGMKVILEGKSGAELEKVLLAEIGEKYLQYSNEEKIVLFFIKKILKKIKNEV